MPRFSVDADIAKAQTLHTDFYMSNEVFEQCREKIFASSWQFIGNNELVKELGDVYPFTLLPDYLNEPLLLTKDKSGELHLLSNVCTHRGNIVAEKACKQANLRCRYHGRLFNLDGKFVSMPEFKEVADFPSKEDDLTALRLFKWSKWLFTSVNPIYPNDLFFRDMMERVNWMPLDEFKFHPE